MRLIEMTTLERAKRVLKEDYDIKGLRQLFKTLKNVQTILTGEGNNTQVDREALAKVLNISPSALDIEETGNDDAALQALIDQKIDAAVKVVTDKLDANEELYGVRKLKAPSLPQIANGIKKVLGEPNTSTKKGKRIKNTRAGDTSYGAEYNYDYRPSQYMTANNNAGRQYKKQLETYKDWLKTDLAQGNSPRLPPNKMIELVAKTPIRYLYKLVDKCEGSGNDDMSLKTYSEYVLQADIINMMDEVYPNPQDPNKGAVINRIKQDFYPKLKKQISDEIDRYANPKEVNRKMIAGYDPVYGMPVDDESQAGQEGKATSGNPGYGFYNKNEWEDHMKRKQGAVVAHNEKAREYNDKIEKENAENKGDPNYTPKPPMELKPEVKYDPENPYKVNGTYAMQFQVFDKLDLGGQSYILCHSNYGWIAGGISPQFSKELDALGTKENGEPAWKLVNVVMSANQIDWDSDIVQNGVARFTKGTGAKIVKSKGKYDGEGNELEPGQPYYNTSKEDAPNQATRTVFSGAGRNAIVHELDDNFLPGTKRPFNLKREAVPKDYPKNWWHVFMVPIQRYVNRLKSQGKLPPELGMFSDVTKVQSREEEYDPSLYDQTTGGLSKRGEQALKKKKQTEQRRGRVQVKGRKGDERTERQKAADARKRKPQ